MPDQAVVIGITRYPDLGSLQGPENDANDFRTWLTQEAPERLAPEHVRMILSSKYRVHKKPTTEQIDEAFQEILDLPRGTDGAIGNRLYIFMAGHGFSPTVEDAALLMANAAKGSTGYHIPGRPYANWFREAAPFREVVLFMDCCRENYRRAPLKNPPWESQSASNPARRCYGFATDWSRDAREIPVGTPPVYRGRFTLAVMEGLRGAAADPGNHQITGASLSEFVYNRLIQPIPASQEIQEPKFDIDRNADIVFNPAAPPPFTVRAAIPAGGAAPVLQDGALQAVAPTVDGPAFREWRLYRGLYLLVRPDGTSQPIRLVDSAEVLNV